jgi:3-hydroxybutyrate dehydrogenase
LDRSWRVAIFDPVIGPAREVIGDHPGLAIELDARDEHQLSEACGEAVQQLGPLRGVVNVAGGNLPEGAQPIDQLTREGWDRVLELNATVAFHVIKHTVPYLRDEGGGSIVAIASSSARTGKPFPGSAYIAAKSAVIGMVKTLAWELGQDSIRINSVSPGFVETAGMVGRVGESIVAMQRVERLAEQAIRRQTTPDNVGEVCAFLLSQCAEGITGRDIPVDNGWLP